MHLFFDTVWKLHIGEIPEKPDFEKLKNNPVFKDYKFYTGYKNEDIQQQHDDEIAAIKQNALTVGNSQIIPRVGNDGFEIFKLDGNFHKWPGSYEILKTLHCDEYHQHTKNSCFTTVAILTLPEEKKSEEFDRFLPCAPKQKDTFGQRQRLKDKLQKLKAAEEKKNTMENMTKELDELLQIYLPDEYYEDIRKKLIPALIRWTASGSVAAPKEEIRIEFDKEEYIKSLVSDLYQARQQLKEREEALKELLSIIDRSRELFLNDKDWAIIEKARNLILNK